jgi:hypothetical protein
MAGPLRSLERPLSIISRSRLRPIRTLTDRASGFLPGVPFGCLGMTGPRSRLRPRPLRDLWRIERPGPREARLITARWTSTPATAARSERYGRRCRTVAADCHRGHLSPAVRRRRGSRDNRIECLELITPSRHGGRPLGADDRFNAVCKGDMF